MSKSPLSVTELTAKIKQLLEQGFAHIRVSGEVSRLTSPASGHLYFTIKDQHAAISAVVWRSTVARLTTRPEEGGEFVFSGHLSLYEPRGSYQLIVSRIEAAGAGQLAAEFERRKQLFAGQGWFEASNKKPVPTIPAHIGIVTSATAAAFEDVKKVFATRPAWLRLTHAPCLVQGNQAAASVANAIKTLTHMPSPPDVILIVRGGGSIEDLWCFNDEKIVKAIVDCPIPVITGIGHEIDTTLADLAADVRAATPSNAVELVCPARDDLFERLPRMQTLSRLMQQQLVRHRHDLGSWVQRSHHHMQRLTDTWHHRSERAQSLMHQHGKAALHVCRTRLRQLEKRLAPLEPGQRLHLQRRHSNACANSLHKLIFDSHQSHRRHLHHLQEKISAHAATLLIRPEHALLHSSQNLHRMQGHILMQKQQASSKTSRELQQQADNILLRHGQHLALLNQQLHALGPIQVLKRGYSLNYSTDGKLITHAAQLKSGDSMNVRFQDGEATTQIKSVSRSKS